MIMPPAVISALAYVNGAWALVEPDLGQYLGHQEKQHHINPQQFAKIPMGNIDRESVKRQDNRAGDKEKSARAPAERCMPL